MHRKIIGEVDMLKRMACLIFSLAVARYSLAESRIWTDKLGNKIEAEFICMSMGRAVIKGNNGKEYKPQFDSLSEIDQQYLQSIIPPEIDIAFSKKQDRRTGSRIMSMRGKVTLTKTNKMPYDGELHAIFYMFGENDYLHEYIILDRTESTFDFKETKTHLIRGNFFRMYDVNSGNRGVEYKGFLVVVLNADNQVVALKSNRKQFIRHISDFVKLRVGEGFSANLESRSSVNYFYDWHPFCYRHQYYWSR